MRRLSLLAAVLLGVALGICLDFENTEAVNVDHDANGLIAMAINTSGTLCVLDENGDVWKVTNHARWIPSSLDPIPVPVSEIKFWHVNTIITFDNTAWVTVAGGSWEYIGAWPGGASPVQDQSWGAIKAGYR